MVNHDYPDDSEYYCPECGVSIPLDAGPNDKGMLNRVGCGGDPYKSHDWRVVHGE